ncbi:MAG: diphosphomevalonate decarboxylase [Bacteroidetes bacterium]|nr:diphosphomevalonate decarboxylase [Bacteroidota bacterium]
MKEIKKVTWRSPSNIALVKYWGKKTGVQIPANPSVSLTLEQCYSETSVSLLERERKSKEVELRFYFDGKENMAFRLRMLKFFDSIAKDFPLLKQYGLLIHSTNSFPHSSGIASSASAMSALALCMCDLQEQLDKKKSSPDKFLQKAALYSRLGSGSASRSIYPYASEWGKAKGVKSSTDQFAIPYEKGLHKIFRNFQDTILIASSSEKKVSSRIGHSLMKTNRFAKTRYAQANSNLSSIISALKKGDLELFGAIVEEEAMTLHALMMCSTPSFILMAPSTLSMIEAVRHFRESSKLPVYFTLDAGPNIHLLYPENIKRKVDEFIYAELEQHCEQGKMIHDNVGKGPIRVK